MKYLVIWGPRASPFIDNLHNVALIFPNKVAIVDFILRWSAHFLIEAQRATLNRQVAQKSHTFLYGPNHP